MFRLPIFRLGRALLTVVFLAAGSHARASIITQPPGLNPGDEYRLVFVTSGTRNASTGIPASVDPFNTFVFDQANAVPELAALGTDWRAIVSSRTLGANENTSTPPVGGVPIFRLDGVRVADNYSDLWDGTLDAPVRVTELGTDYSGDVWTGTNELGNPSDNPLGSVNATVGIGLADATDSGWIDFSRLPQNVLRPAYAMSGTLTAVATVPEPSSLVCFGVLLTLCALRRKPV